MWDITQLTAFAEDGEGTLGEVVRADGVLEPRVVGSGINQEGVTELSDVPQPLERLGVDHLQRPAVYLDVVPERIADNLESVWRHDPVRRVVRPRQLPA